jgi:putative flippase GtrA
MLKIDTLLLNYMCTFQKKNKKNKKNKNLTNTLKTNLLLLCSIFHMCHCFFIQNQIIRANIKYHKDFFDRIHIPR